MHYEVIWGTLIYSFVNPDPHFGNLWPIASEGLSWRTKKETILVNDFCQSHFLDIYAWVLNDLDYY